MAATLVERLPEGDAWMYEVKLDGYRALLLKDGEHVQIRSRNDRDLTKMYPTVAAAAGRLRAERAVVDGEIVALDAAGRPSFQALQHRSSHRDYDIVFYAFDLLQLAAQDLTGLPLVARRARLPRLTDGSGIRLSIELPGTAAEVIAAVRSLGLEGVVAKRKDSIYEAGVRGEHWVKLKLDRRQEFVIGGFRPGTNGIDALLVGYHDGGELRFAAKVRAGFVPHVRREVARKLKGLQMDACPFVDLPSVKASRWGGGIDAEEMREMRWVQPLLVAEVRFVEWTADDRLRHPVFLALRADKDARAVRREL